MQPAKDRKVMDFSILKGDRPVVNAWTDWGNLEVVVVGRVDVGQCLQDEEPGFRWRINDKDMGQLLCYPAGKRPDWRVRVAQE